MYTTIRRYRRGAGSSMSIEEAAQKTQQGFIPIIRQVPGFVGYYGVNAGSDELITISVFENRDGAEESVRRAAEWVKSNFGDAFGAPEVMSGEVIWEASR